jgi:hypothetical protein
MAKLYLIRRNLETFAGPLTLAEMKDAHKRMQFGLQDEVSGHCGPWVQLDALERLKKHYPEVARIVHEEMLAGWGVSSPAERIVNEDTRRLASQSKRGVGLALAFLLIALVAFAAAVYMAGVARFSGKVKDPAEGLKPIDAQTFLDRGDAAAFQQYMAAHGPDLVDKANRNRGPGAPDLLAPWLPYLRLYAFTTDGQVGGLDPKILRGQGVAAAPIDCSLKFWKREWRGSMKGWNDFVVQRKLVHAHWARLLAWDPWWVRRRDNKGWIGTQNFYVGCLTMADKALADLATDASLVTNAADWDRVGFNKVRQRVAWLLDVSRTGSSLQPTAPAVDNNLATWTCFEAAKDQPGLAKCRDGMTAESDLWNQYLEERYGWSLLRVAAGQHGPLADQLVQGLTTQAAKMNKLDHYTRFDYRAEAKLLKTVIKQGTPVEKAVERTQVEFPDVRLSH